MKSSATFRGRPISEESSFRAFLQAELLTRCDRNPAYSLRAFAQDLGLDHSTLSQILRAKRVLTSRNIEKLGAALSLPEDTIAAFVDQERRSGGLPLARKEQVDQLAQEAAIVLSDWIHYALLELTHVSGFRADSRWIASVLGVDTDAINIAVSRLARLGLLRMEGPDRWLDTTGSWTVSVEAFPAIAIDRLLARVREFDGSDGRSISIRDDSATTIAVSRDRIPEALDCIARFRRELIALLEKDDGKDDVYRLEVHFHPVTNLHREM